MNYVARTILFLRLEHKIHIFEPPCYILYICCFDVWSNVLLFKLFFLTDVSNYGEECLKASFKLTFKKPNDLSSNFKVR